MEQNKGNGKIRHTLTTLKYHGDISYFVTYVVTKIRQFKKLLSASLNFPQLPERQYPALPCAST